MSTDNVITVSPPDTVMPRMPGSMLKNRDPGRTDDGEWSEQGWTSVSVIAKVIRRQRLLSTLMVSAGIFGAGQRGT